MLLIRSAAVVEDNRFETCSSLGGGAVMARYGYASGEPGVLRRNVFVGNYAWDLGGAIEVSAGARVVIESNTFASNHADDRGGAILVNDSGTTATLSRNIFWNNTVGANGAAVAGIGSSGPTRPSRTRGSATGRADSSASGRARRERPPTRADAG
jgi:predicted outer membrane repeat protein